MMIEIPDHLYRALEKLAEPAGVDTSMLATGLLASKVAEIHLALGMKK